LRIHANFGTDPDPDVDLDHSVADPDPGSGAFLTPGSGIRDGLKVSIRDEQPGSYFLELKTIFGFLGVKILKFFDADPGSRIWDRDSLDQGSGIWDPG
jgi:hypothetical protein